MIDDDGNWVARADVRYVHVMDQRGVDYKNLETFGDVRNEWLMPKQSFGAELGFGEVLGTYHEEPVLLLKACIGNRSLGWDLLPPGSERFEHDGKIYAGYKDVANFWDKGTEPKPVPWYAGRQYDADVAHAKAVLRILRSTIRAIKVKVMKSLGLFGGRVTKIRMPHWPAAMNRTSFI